MENFEENMCTKKFSYRRTTQEQLECFLEFIREFPEIKTNKNYPSNPRRMQDLWKNLSQRLNALKGPTRLPSEWKKSLLHWKNQVKSKSRKLKASKSITGGGPPSECFLKSFEERALEAFGTITVDGDPEVHVIGLDTSTDTEMDVSLVFEEPSTSSSQQVNSPSPSQVAFPSNLQISASHRISPTKSKMSAEKIYEDIVKIMTQREESAQKFNEQFLDSQNKLAYALTQIGEGMQSLAQAIQKKN